VIGPRPVAAHLGRVSIMVPIITAITALAGGALGAWWKTKDLNTQIAAEADRAIWRIAHERQLSRIERLYPAKHEWYTQYHVAADRLIHAMGDLKAKERYDGGDPGGYTIGKTEDELLAEVMTAAGQLEDAAQHLDLIAPEEMVTRVNVVSREIVPAITSSGIPKELHMPIHEIRKMMRNDLGADR